jgi:hypothetical protein
MGTNQKKYESLNLEADDRPVCVLRGHSEQVAVQLPEGVLQLLQLVELRGGHVAKADRKEEDGQVLAAVVRQAHCGHLPVLHRLQAKVRGWCARLWQHVYRGARQMGLL